MRIALGIEYDGGAYCGFETQTNGPTVQATLEDAISAVAGNRIQTICAGRTDARVHACGQVVHFDCSVDRSSRSWVFGSNSNLPRDINVLWARAVDSGFHARFSATRRHYRYLLLNRPIRSALLDGRTAWECRPLDALAMQKAADLLCGEHDFSAYRSSACQAPNPVRTVHRLDVERRENMIRIDVEANAFLHHMVRNIVGVLMAVGLGKQDPEWASQVLEGRDRAKGAVTAPACGLYLMAVRYPDQFDLPRVSVPGGLW